MMLDQRGHDAAENLHRYAAERAAETDFGEVRRIDRRHRLMSAVAIVVVAAFAVLTSVWLLGSDEPPVVIEPPVPTTGKIAFSSYGFDDEGWSDIYVMNQDGTGLVNLTNNEAYDKAPAWSPDRSRIAFVREASTGSPPSASESSPVETIYLMDADGSNVVRLTEGVNPSWSPQGDRILFDRDTGANRWDIFVIDVDGTDEANLTNAPSWDNSPGWSPDGSRIVFASNRHEGPESCDDESPSEDCNLEIWTMNLDGSNPVRLTHEPGIDGFPDWSPDGTRIVFHTVRDGDLSNGEGFEVYVMNADGTNQINLSNHPGLDGHPNWSPDGTRVVFASTRDDDPLDKDIYLIDPDGTNLTRLTTIPLGGDAMWPNW